MFQVARTRRGVASLGRCVLTVSAIAAVCGLASDASARQGGDAAARPAIIDPAAQPVQPVQPVTLRTPAEQAAKAIAYLRAAQDEKTGGWAIPPQGPTFPAITALVVRGMLMEPGITADDPSVKRGVEFILSKQQPDGGIYDQLLPSYNTAISISALAKLPRTKELQERIDKAVAFLKSLQYGEEAQEREGFAENAAKVDPDHAFYGGWGYGRHGRPDLSNTAWAVEALKDAGVDPSDAAFKRALVFIQRTQMTGASVQGKPVNDMPYAAGSTQGGFIYSTSVNRETIGGGQSMAGEIAETIAGDAGTVATARLGKDAGGKPLMLSGNEIERRIHLRMKETTDPEIHPEAGNFIVVLGPSPDGIVANDFTIHFSVKNVEKVRSLLWEVLSQELADAAAVQVKPINHWQGVSRLRAYGSMTYSGFKSYLYAGLTKDDPRVTAALDWIAANYTVEENPGMGTDGMYYYYVVFARAMHATGQATVEVVGADGGKTQREWGTDLVRRLSTLQNEDGSYKSVDDRWMENNPVLITAYGLLAVQHGRGE